MEELLIEEKAKRYDSMFERLKEMYNNNKTNVAARLICERYFPELKECEDEMMIQYFKDLAPFDKAEELYEKYGFSHKDAIAWLEKQGEQKQVEWSEEDKKHIEYIEYLLNQEKYNHPQYQPNIDERIAWLKSLRPQKQQYDDEWSDEDKEFLKLTLSNLTELKDRYGEGYGRVGGCIDWLKSLKDRYTWKPTKEQLTELRCVISGCGYDIEPLVELEKELKAL